MTDTPTTPRVSDHGIPAPHFSDERLEALLRKCSDYGAHLWETNTVPPGGDPKINMSIPALDCILRNLRDCRAALAAAEKERDELRKVNP